MLGKPFSETRLETDYAEAFNTWKQQPDRATTSRLLKTVEPEIDRGISAHVGASNPLLKSRARQLTLKALSSYDPQRASLGTHIVNHLQGLKRVARQQTQVLPMPERVAQSQALLNQKTLELTDELGREPSTRELSDRVGLSPAKIAKIRRYRQPISEGYFAGRQNDDGDQTFQPAVQNDSHAWLEIVYDDLGPTDQLILEKTLGLHGSQVMSNAQLARMLRLSPGAISQRKARIQALLDQEGALSPWQSQ